MCGIAGVVASGRAIDLGDCASRMASALAHRGPDGAGTWLDEAAGLALAHRRLSVVDLSPAGHQPMQSACARHVIAFNGEVYNHRELRERLAWSGTQVRWRGGSDTETLLECIAAWGIGKALEASVGMFAFAVWDRQERVLTLARDRLGEKPLYYGLIGDHFWFGSELKAARAVAGARLEVDRGALALLMRFGYVPEPHCIYRGLHKLQPGTWLELGPQALQRAQLPRPRAYWSAVTAARAGVGHPLRFSSDVDAKKSLDRQLRDAVRLQMVSDVPLGAFLSGGVDSSLVVALMQAQSATPVRTFSIGFEEDAYDEARHAQAVARHLATDHAELYVTARDALEVIPRLPVIYDEPFADVSQVPTFLLARLARRQVTVSLSGDGGDELFGGYTRYFLAARLWRTLGSIPRPLRRAAAAALRTLSPGQWDAVLRRLGPVLPGRGAPYTGDRLHKAAGVIGGRSGQDLYESLVSHWDPARLVLGRDVPPAAIAAPWPDLPSLTERMLALDALTYLPGDILAKVDRAAMAVSLETRVPLLDHRVYEFAWSLPLHYKVREGQGKWLLRQVLYDYVPRRLVDRPKMGFGVPLGAWLRGPLRDWAEALLDPVRLRADAYLDAEPVRRKWREHLSGQRNWEQLLWNVLMFQAWLEGQR